MTEHARPPDPTGDPLPCGTIELTDPRAMRAYAHPVRLKLLGLLRTEGPMTATQAAARLGESSGTCSFHLRQLAKYGFCEEAGGGRGREKPWRATALFTTWKGAFDDPELADAERRLDAAIVQRYVEQITRWLAARPGDAPEWRDAAGFGDLVLPLTADELERLRRDIQALVRPYVRRIAGAEAPPGARRTLLVGFAFPDPDEQP